MKIFKILAWLGVIMVIGTAGSSDTEYISFSQIVAQITTGILFSAVSYLMYILTYRPKAKIKRRGKVVPIESLRKVG